MSEQRVITPKYVNAPKPGKKMGSVALEDGSRLAAYSEVLAKMQPGKTYSCTVESQQWTNGQVWVIKGVSEPTPAQKAVASNEQSDKERMMFIMGVCGRAMGSGKFDATDIRLLTMAARDAYDTVITGKQENDDPFDDGGDSVPF